MGRNKKFFQNYKFCKELEPWINMKMGYAYVDKIGLMLVWVDTISV